MIPRKQIRFALYLLNISLILAAESTSWEGNVKDDDHDDHYSEISKYENIITDDYDANYASSDTTSKHEGITASVAENLRMKLKTSVEHNELESNTTQNPNGTIETTILNPFSSKSYETEDWLTASVRRNNRIYRYSRDLSNDTSTTSTSTANPCEGVSSAVIDLTVIPTTNTLSVSWDISEESGTCVSSFNVTWWHQGTNYVGFVLVTTTKYVILNLSPCTSYTVSVEGIGSNLGVTDIQSVSVNTSESVLSTIANVRANSLEYGLNVTWDVPEEATCLLAYTITALVANTNESIQSQNVSRDISYHVFTDLKACLNYSITVFSVSISGRTSSPSVAYGQPDAIAPGSVNNLTITSSTDSTIAISWDSPTTNPDCVQYYSISVCYGDDCIEGQTVDTIYVATGLSPCRTYSVSVVAAGTAGESPGTSTTANTTTVKPGAPKELTATSGQYSVALSWQPPSTGATCVSFYRISIWRNITTTTYTTNTTNINITNLVACYTYTAQVIAVDTQAGDSNAADLIEIKIEASVQDPPVQDTDSPSVTKDSISIAWRLNQTNNRCELNQLITTCTAISTEGTGYSMINGSSTNDLTGLEESSALIRVNATVTALSPFTNYTCSGVTINEAGPSVKGDPVTVITSEDVPSAPVLNTPAVGSSSVTLIWQTPELLPGRLLGYEVSLNWTRSFLMPSWCQYDSFNVTLTDIDGTVLNYVYDNAVPYSNHTAIIRATTNAGWGPFSSPIVFETLADAPGMVTGLTYATIRNSTEPNYLDTLLSWGLPCTLNGIIESFEINVLGTRRGFEEHNFTRLYPANGISDPDQMFVMNFGELRAEHNYTFVIAAKVQEVDQLGESTSHNALYPAGIPAQPNDSYIQNMTLVADLMNNSLSTVVVLLPLFPNDNGEILYYAVMVSEFGQSDPQSARLDSSSKEWPNTSPWHRAISSDPIIVYQATPKWWEPNTTGHVVDFGHLKAVRYVIGEDDNCTIPSDSGSTEDEYCNGPLRSGTRYQVHMRAFTEAGYADSVAFDVKTDAGLNVFVVIGIILGILLLGVITTMSLLIRRGSLQTVIRKFLHSDLRGSPVPDAYTKKKFQLHCQALIENPGKLSNEFQLLQTLSVDLQMAANDACLQANRRKNRYMDILPYDITRVKLDVIDNDPNSDYINASFVHGFSGDVEYIACQGPKEDTSYDFWRMICQYNVKIIVMVTQLVEKDKEKCHQYFPNKREHFEYDDIAIRCTTQLDYISYAQRLLTIFKGNMKRTVTHLHFKEWSDHGVPDDFHSMIQFCQIVRKHMIDNKSLAVVHCSAGVGRTGTLIALDILLQQIKDNKKLDVFGTVFKLRQDRINMVQTESQYAYIYNCTRQALRSPYMLKPAKQRPVEHTYENVPYKANEIVDSNTNLVGSVETLKKISPASSLESMDLVNEDKSREPKYTTQLSTLSTGLRYSKSTSAMDAMMQSNILVRGGSHGYPIYEPVRDSMSSINSMDTNGLLGTSKKSNTLIAVIRPRSVDYDKDVENVYELTCK